MHALTTYELPDFHAALSREWLSVNGDGGFGSGTISGAATRRYHAYLTAVLPPPYGRMAILGKVEETVTVAGTSYDLSANLYPNNTISPTGFLYLETFEPYPVPTWVYRLPNGATITKSVFLARHENTVHILYQLEETTDTTTITVRPLVCWKDYHREMRPWYGFPADQHAEGDTYLLRPTSDAPTLKMQLANGIWQTAGWWNEHIQHPIERERGFDSEEALYCPATITLPLIPGQRVAFTASIEANPQPAETALQNIVHYQELLVLAAGKAAQDDTGRDLVLAADQFIVKTGTGNAHRTTIIAGYPWFTDWGRDTMISLPGLCLKTGRLDEAREILASFAAHIDGGLIPNRFPDHGSTPEYNTVDATLWYIHACDQYAQVAKDKTFRTEMLPVLQQIIEAHRVGTKHNIHVDTEDSLLIAGEPGVQLTWMDAKVGDWVVTPRHGKPVEVNALWINALTIVARWAGRKAGSDYVTLAERATASFREKFVRPDKRGLYDVLSPDGIPDACIRPNQIIAAALPIPLLDKDTLRTVVDTVTQELLTPYGLRSLATSDSAYCSRYHGDSLSRDGAYHQGTVWSWLMGGYIDAYRRVYGKRTKVDVASCLLGLEAHLREYGVGGIAEIFDGDSPFHPNGCPWQAWGVAELLRVRET